MKYKFLFALCIALGAAHGAQAVETRYLEGFGDTRYHRIDSEVIARPYHIFVMVPDGYDESDHAYPTLYLLDGGELFPLFAAYYRYLNFGEEVPDMIIVGISYGSDDFENGNFRSTDYTAPSAEREYWGGAARFQQFLRTELLPQIEKDYRSRADRRVIFGQSIGGQFVLYTAQTAPELFWGHIASNPALHRNLPFFLQEHAVAGEHPVSSLFVGSGTDDEPQFRAPARQWIEHWSARTAKPWRLMTTDLQDHSHMSAPPASFRAGLRWLFGAESP